jgi:peptidyl-prolyl cis-trans isomerase D
MQLNARIVGELRDLRYVTLPLERFIDSGPVDEASVASYYEEHLAEFMRPESVVLDYIELSLDDFRQPVEEAVLREQYELQMEDYAYQTRHRVSHILLEESGDASLSERLEAALAALNAGRDFAEVAREFSDDIGSASGGGDLGYTTGDTFPPEMETAIAALELDTVSKPVKTDAGTHLILVTEREDAAPPSFEEMRDELEDSVQVAEARVELLRTVESLKDQVFNAEDLTGPAEELGLEVQRSEPVLRDQAGGRFGTPALLSAAFSEDVLEMGHNSEVLELADDTWVVLRVHQHEPAAPRPLTEVRDEVAEAIRRDRAAEAVADAATTLAEGLRNGDARIEDFATENDYEWRVELAVRRDNMSVPPTVLQRVFRLPAPAEGENTVDTVTTPAGDLQVVELLRVQPGELSRLEPAGEQRLRQQISGEFAGFVDGEFQRRLRDDADISVL